MSELLRRLRAVFRRDRLDRDLEAEMRIHLEMKADETGDPAAARRAFGNPLLLWERSREVWGWRWLADAALDVRFALRMFRRNPGFTAIALFALALGIGVNTAVFTLADTILLRPLPALHPEQLVSIYHQNPQDALISSSWPDYEYYRDHNQVLSGLAAYLRVPVVLRIHEAAEQVRGELVSGNYFQVLGVQPVLGRAFSADDIRAGAAPVAILSHDYWQRRLGGDPGVLGQTLVIGGHEFTTIGVAPRAFKGVVMDWGGPPAVWLPVTTYRQAVPALAGIDILHRWEMQSFLLAGRLRPGVTVERAQAAIAVLSDQAAGLREQAFQRRMPFKAVLLPLQQGRFWPSYRAAVRRFLGVLAGVVALVLLIACFNIANLWLALASKRRKEIAVRLAVGISRARLLRQLLMESLVLAILGGAIGLGVASWTMRFLTSFPGAFGAPVVLTSGLDTRAFGFAFLVSLVATILFGMAPARQTTRMDLTSAMRADAGSDGPRGIPVRNALVAAQVALSLVVLIGAGLFGRSLRNALDQDATAGPDSLLTVSFDLAGWGYDQQRTSQFYQQLLDRVRALPGVSGAALVWTLPLSGIRSRIDAAAGESQPLQANFNVVSEDYFVVAGLLVLRGRELTERDRGSVPPMAVINAQAAERLWPGQDPIGKPLRLKGLYTGLALVVGVVRDGGLFQGLRDPTRPCVYLPLDGASRRTMNLEVRTSVEPLQYAAAIRSEFRKLDKELPVSIATWKSHRDLSLGQERLAMVLLSGLGVLALLLAVVGVYGVVSFAVASRTHEIGIRAALGAGGSDVLRLVLRQVMGPVLAGLGIGVGAALALASLIATLLYKVAATDALTFAASSLLLIVVAAAAAGIPARRAAKISPLEAFRHE